MNMFEFQIKSHINAIKRNSQAFYKYLHDSLNIHDEIISEESFNTEIQFRQDLKTMFSLEDEKEEEFYRHKLPHIINNSIIISSFSLFEFNFKKLAYSVKMHWHQSSSYDDKWRKIDDYRNTIYKITGCKFDALDGYWGEINKVRKIRNLIVHHGSTIRKCLKRDICDQPDYNLLKSHKKINLSEDTGYFIINDSTIVDDFFDNSNKYLDGLYEIFQKNNFGKAK